MNSITLNFKVKLLEKEYREQKSKMFSIITLYQQWIAVLINITTLIGCLIQKDWIIFSFCLTSIIILMVSIKLKSKYPILYEFIIIFFIVFVNAYLSMGKYFNLTQATSTYAEGFFVSLACISFLNILSFFERTLIVLIVLLMHCIFGIEYQENNIIVYVRLSLCTIMYLQYAYQFEKAKKQEYIEQRKNQQFLQKFTKFNDIQSYAARYDERKSLVLVEKNNSKRVKKEDQDYFNHLIQIMKLSMKNHKQRITDVFASQNGISPNIQTLKSILLGMVTEQSNENIADTPLNRSDIYLHGCYEQQTFNLCIFQRYDMYPVTVLLMKESRSETQEEELKLRMKNQSKQQIFLKQIFDNQVKQSLIYFRWIQNYSNKQTDIVLINRLLKSVHYLLLKAYTEFLNLECFNHLNIQKVFQQRFNIEDLVQSSIKICDGCLKNTAQSLTNLVDFEIKNYLGSSMIFSDYQSIQLLMLNVLFYTSKLSQTVIIELEDVVLQTIDKPLIKVKITYQLPNKTKNQIQNLPILNPQSLQELKHNSSVPLDLELPISIVLIRRLGPFDKMKIIQNKRTSNYIEFYLFKDLPTDSLLIPVISLNPSEKITTQQHQSIANTFSTSFHRDSVPESILFI